MFRKRIIPIFAIVLCVVTIFWFSENRIRNDVLLRSRARYNPETDLIYTRYQTSLELNKLSGGRISTFVPRFRETTFEIANIYANLFAITENFLETEESFIFSTGDRELIIHKFVSKVEYRNNAINKFEEGIQISHEEAIEIAEDFFRSNLLELNYEEAFITFEDGIFNITFIGRLGSLKNMGFANNIQITKSGDVISAEYYYTTYERLNSLDIKSVYQAFHELPIDLGSDNMIYITDYQLVYIYANSIIQPAYFFRGVVDGGGYFESFVKAISLR
ncbi:MAG: hypothetical protein FWD82_05005 [Defluviitaleaceae bacterium]|nr:hypothetical protein [Defluviitaleaceae bacterium]